MINSNTNNKIKKLSRANVSISEISNELNEGESNRKAMNRNCSNQKANPALKTKTGNK